MFNTFRKCYLTISKYLFLALILVRESSLQMRQHSFDEAYFPFDDVLSRFESVGPVFTEGNFNQLAGALILAGRFLAAERVGYPLKHMISDSGLIALDVENT